MLLDDPLSAVDSHVGNTLFNEAVCCESLFEKGGSAPRKRIVILVTHQIQFLSSPRVDRVVVMDQGRITATGSYTELVEQGKLEFVGSGGAEEEGAKRAMSLSGEVLPVKPDRALQQASANESTQSLGIDSDLGSPAVSSDDLAKMLEKAVAEGDNEQDGPRGRATSWWQRLSMSMLQPQRRGRHRP